MRPGLIAFLVAIALPLAACGGGSGGTAATDWDGPPVPDDGGALAVDGFNAYLDEHPEFASAPALAAARFVALDRASAATTSIVAKAGPEGEGPVTATVTLDGLLDDSVRAQQYVLELSPGGDGWRVDSAVVTQRCHAGRGHQAFTPEPCV